PFRHGTQPRSSAPPRRLRDRAHSAGTAFDGEFLYQIAENVIHKIDQKTGRIVSTIPAPGNGGDSGFAWAEGSLWVGQH
ncbi:glutamine cyclotransferase, partial [Rhizobium leguminosarum]